MENQQILQKALKKANKAGFKEDFIFSGFVQELLCSHDGDGGFYNRDWESLIFNKDFAKAIFGSEMINPYGDKYFMENWKYHLQKMVISDYPILYLENYV